MENIYCRNSWKVDTRVRLRTSACEKCF